MRRQIENIIFALIILIGAFMLAYGVANIIEDQPIHGVVDHGRTGGGGSF